MTKLEERLVDSVREEAEDFKRRADSGEWEGETVRSLTFVNGVIDKLEYNRATGECYLIAEFGTSGILDLGFDVCMADEVEVRRLKVI